MPRDGITKVVSDRTGAVSYRARVSFTDRDGKRRHRSKSFRTKRAAEQWRRQQLTAIDTGTYYEPVPVTLGEVAQRWLTGVERGRAPSTYLQYHITYHRHIAPRFGHRKLSTVRPSDVQTFYDELGQTYRAETVKTVHTVLRGIYRHAIADGLIAVNPTDERRLPTDRRDQPTVWTPDQVRTFLAAIDDDDDALLYQVLILTGLRIGEALGLKWDAVDLNAGTLHVRRTLQHTPDGWTISDATKTDASVRTVMLPERAARALCRQRERGLPGDIVFCNATGGPLTQQGVRDRLDTLCEKAGVPRITPHACRRICATLLARQGVHVAVAARMLGHDITTMLRLYTAVQPDHLKTAADAMDRVLEG